ncbi:plasmid SOS inhibition protein A [Salmonella enterica subsp. enterica serovar Chailey]|nr:plasmid SOS inhibition protein A [Salmonella enterica subsp. enterica serovar Chailey]
MIPKHLSLVPLSNERRAAMQAIADVEDKSSRHIHMAEYPYAHAFFRHLKGSKRITSKEISFFLPMTDKELRGRKSQWVSAIDTLIESRGTRCYLPLPSGAGSSLFPAVQFQQAERVRRQAELSGEKYSRQNSKERSLREMAYAALAGQAEIDLAFQTPDTVSAWNARWSGDIHLYDLEAMFFRWTDKIPSLSRQDLWAWKHTPFWSVLYEVAVLSKEAPRSVRLADRWSVPNKLCSPEASRVE